MLKSAKSLNIKYYTMYCCISPVRVQKLTPAASLPFLLLFMKPILKVTFLLTPAEVGGNYKKAVHAEYKCRRFTNYLKFSKACHNVIFDLR